MIYRNVISIQNDYFSILEKMYGDLFECYLEHDKSFDKAIDIYISRQPIFYVSGYNNNLSAKRDQLFNEINMFWNSKAYELEIFIKNNKSVGVFGAGDNIYVSEYKEEVIRNSLFFDLLVFNDPFYMSYTIPEELDIESNIKLFYRNIIYILDIKEYILNSNDFFVIIFPFDYVVSHDEKNRIANIARDEGIKFSQDIFGICNEDYHKDIDTLKNLDLMTAQLMLYQNGLFYKIDDAMNYTQSLINDSERKELECFCIEELGQFNRDILRCVLLERVLPNIVTVSFFTYRFHKEIAMKLQSHPIISHNEWMPIKNDESNHSFKATDEYMFSCAIHRNDKMSRFVFSNLDEILFFRDKSGPKEFRTLFHKATEDVYHSYDDFVIISKEVYSKLDELIEDTLKDIQYDKARRKRKTLVGFIKGVAGFIPVLSYMVSTYDICESAKYFFNTIKDEETIVEYLSKK